MRVGAHRLVPGPGDWAAGAQRAGVRGSAHDGAGEVEEEEDFLEEENGDLEPWMENDDDDDEEADY